MLMLYSLIEERHRRQKSILAALTASGKPKASGQSSRERSKLLKRVLIDALDDHEFAVVLVDMVARLVRDDPKLTQQMRDSLKADRRGPRGTAYWEDLLLVRTYERYRRLNNATFEAALYPLADQYAVSSETMRGKLSRALKRVPPEARRLWGKS